MTETSHAHSLLNCHGVYVSWQIWCTQSWTQIWMMRYDNTLWRHVSHILRGTSFFHIRGDDWRLTPNCKSLTFSSDTVFHHKYSRGGYNSHKGRRVLYFCQRYRGEKDAFGFTWSFSLYIFYMNISYFSTYPPPWPVHSTTKRCLCCCISINTVAKSIFHRWPL